MAYAGNPNGANQLWSRWIFFVHDAGHVVSRAELELNAARWLRKGFGTAAAARVRRKPYGWRFDALVEGKPAHDPDYVASVKRAFKKFVLLGFGPIAWGDVYAHVVAGSKQDGKPAEQLVVIPTILEG